MTGFATQASASSYPEKQIFLIVPFAAGGSTDILARYVADKLGKSLGQRVLVDNRPGGGGVVATEAVVRAPKDGYTLLFHTTALAIMAATRKSIDVKQELTPVSLLSLAPFYLVASNALPVNNVEELIAYGKKNPSKLNFGSPGPATTVHLAGELFNAMAGIAATHVPYKGNAPALVAIMSNDIQYMFDTQASSKPLIDDNKIKLLAVSTKDRTPYAPQTPSIAESGLPGYESGVWMGVLAPAGTPKDIVEKLSSALHDILFDEAAKPQLTAQGMEPKGLSPKQFEDVLNADIDRFTKLVRDLKLDIQ